VTLPKENWRRRCVFVSKKIKMATDREEPWAQGRLTGVLAFSPVTRRKLIMHVCFGPCEWKNIKRELARNHRRWYPSFGPG
jgi:hypothetical protein